jgi:hypothetical protein
LSFLQLQTNFHGSMRKAAAKFSFDPPGFRLFHRMWTDFWPLLALAASL